MQGWGFEEDYVEKLQFFAKVQGPADENIWNFLNC